MLCAKYNMIIFVVQLFSDMCTFFCEIQTKIGGIFTPEILHSNISHIHSFSHYNAFFVVYFIIIKDFLHNSFPLSVISSSVLSFLIQYPMVDNEILCSKHHCLHTGLSTGTKFLYVSVHFEHFFKDIFCNINSFIYYPNVPSPYSSSYTSYHFRKDTVHLDISYSFSPSQTI